jgi:hypothetical protein
MSKTRFEWAAAKTLPTNASTASISKPRCVSSQTLLPCPSKTASKKESALAIGLERATAASGGSYRARRRGRDERRG